jgi:hypothetical protein
MPESEIGLCSLTAIFSSIRAGINSRIFFFNTTQFLPESNKRIAELRQSATIQNEPHNKK